jgi:membrane-associated phospholipid phosphatase
MQRQPEVKAPEVWERFAVWLGLHRPIARLIGTSAGLVVILLLIPPYWRAFLWSRLLSHKILASMLLVFSLLAVSLVWSTGQQVDTWAFLFFNVRGARPVWLDRTMLIFTQIGSGITALGIALILFFTGSRLLSYELLLGSVTLWLVVELIKFLAHRSRPFIRLTQARVVGFRPIGRSFPSGHTSQVFFLATLFAPHFLPSVWVIFLLYAAAALVGITRMYVGAHYPRDVLAGAILGSAWGVIGAGISGYVLSWIG